MLMVVPNEGKLYFSDVTFGVELAEDLEFQLYSNNYTPVDTTTAGDFTPATFTGAGVFTVLTTDWIGAAISANVAEQETLNVPTWTHGGGAGQTVYGWFAVTAVGGVVAMAQRFDAARTLTSGSIESLDPAIAKLKTFA